MYPPDVLKCRPSSLRIQPGAESLVVCMMPLTSFKFRSTTPAAKLRIRPIITSHLNLCFCAARGTTHFRNLLWRVHIFVSLSLLHHLWEASRARARVTMATMPLTTNSTAREIVNKWFLRQRLRRRHAHDSSFSTSISIYSTLSTPA